MVAAGTHVVASVSGSFDWLKAPESLASYVRTHLAAYGEVVSVKVATALLSSAYTADVVYVTGQSNGSVENIRSTVADIFEAWNGFRPAVSIVQPAGEAAQTAPGVLPTFDPSKYSGLLWAAVALIVVVNVAPLFRSR